MLNPLLLALAALLSSPALADDEETFTYRLTANGQPVGERTITVRYIQNEEGEARLLESYTELSLASGRSVFELRQRIGGQGRAPAGTFTATTSQTDLQREVQAVRSSESWRVTIIEPERLSSEEYLLRDVDATSLSLVDPANAGLMESRTQLRVLSAETGEILAGAVAEAGRVTLELGGKRVEAQSYLWSTADGEVELVYGEAGHLLRYTVQIAGVSVQAELTAAPAARSFGEAFDVNEVTGGSSIQEEGL